MKYRRIIFSGIIAYIIFFLMYFLKLGALFTFKGHILMTTRNSRLHLIIKPFPTAVSMLMIFTEQPETYSLVLEDGKLEKIACGTEAGTGIRLISRCKTAYAFSNDMSGSAAAGGFWSEQGGCRQGSASCYEPQDIQTAVDFQINFSWGDFR